MHFSTDARAVAIGDLHLRLGERFTYEYDFGDCWIHDLRIEAALPIDPRLSYPSCTAGHRAAPPEDCGGPHAFMTDRFVYALIGERQSCGRTSSMTWTRRNGTS
ncbi:plasmid pRiA4b ORF-3 family protein [Variovorax gracilis]|uniref:plasmid pRiA4b ORF-3 family protein n=1 Tax=Variovorax gracilis TaxID=3053502 RepID=UPI00336BD83E